MGTSQRDLIRYATVGTEGQLAMDAMPYAGRSQTSPARPGVVRHRLRRGRDGHSQRGQDLQRRCRHRRRREPGPDRAREGREGRDGDGLVTNSQITDATPASFGSHVENRDCRARSPASTSREQARGDPGRRRRLLVPGGQPRRPPRRAEEDPEEKSAGTEGNLVQRAEDLGYEYATDAAELRAAGGPRLLGLFANEEMFQQNPEGEGAVYDPQVALSEMTQKAIDTLSQDPDGFFLWSRRRA
jgi:alkaline phosphatase